MGGKSAKRRANQAAEESRQAAADYRTQTTILKKRTEDEIKKSQRMLLRSLRSRGAGFFETDFMNASKLGGEGGTLG